MIKREKKRFVNKCMYNLIHGNCIIFCMQIDHSIVESFGGKGMGCITARVYPTKAIGDRVHLYAFNNGDEDVHISSLTAWSMKKAQIS